VKAIHMAECEVFWQ